MTTNPVKTLAAHEKDESFKNKTGNVGRFGISVFPADAVTPASSSG